MKHSALWGRLALWLTAFLWGTSFVIVKGTLASLGVLWILALRFLGATPDTKIPELKSALAEVCANHQSFQLEINKMGAFGSHYNPEVLWLGFQEFQLFKNLHLDLEPRLQTQGFEPYYGNFVPHITLCRVKQVVNKQRFWKAVESLQPDFSQSLSITELTLYQSFLHKEGPEYKALATYPLQPFTK